MSVFLPQLDQQPKTAEPPKQTLADRLRVAALIFLGVLLGIPVVLAVAAAIFWDSIDQRIRSWCDQVAVVEPGELHGAALDLYNRKLRAVWFTLEPEPFVTFSMQELNSEIMFLMNTGGFVPGLRNLTLSQDQYLLKATTIWTGPEMAGMLTTWGYATGTFSGPVVRYVRRLSRLQFEVWIRPCIEQGLLSWDIVRANLNGTAVPPDLARWLQERLMPKAGRVAVGPPTRRLKETRVTQAGLLLKWMPAARR